MINNQIQDNHGLSIEAFLALVEDTNKQISINSQQIFDSFQII